MKRMFLFLGLMVAAANSWAIPATIYVSGGGNGSTRNAALAKAEANAAASCKNIYGGSSALVTSYVYTKGSSLGGDSYGATATVACTYEDKNVAEIGAMVGTIKPLTGACLDAEGYGVGNGTAIQTWSCNYSNNQLWTVRPNSGYIYGVGSGRVLDVVGYGTTNGTQLQLYDASGTANQKWEFRNAAILGVGGKALDVVGGATTNGARIQIWTQNENPQQRWSYNPESGEIKGIGGKCLDVPNGAQGNEIVVQLWDCNGSAQQKWSVDEHGTIRYAGWCLTAQRSVSTDGTVVYTYKCDGQVGQSWRFIGELRSIASDRCLTQTSSADGARPVIYDCYGGTDQVWEYSPY